MSLQIEDWSILLSSCIQKRRNGIIWRGLRPTNVIYRNSIILHLSLVFQLQTDSYSFLYLNYGWAIFTLLARLNVLIAKYICRDQKMQLWRQVQWWCRHHYWEFVCKNLWNDAFEKGQSRASLTLTKAARQIDMCIVKNLEFRIRYGEVYLHQIQPTCTTILNH